MTRLTKHLVPGFTFCLLIVTVTAPSVWQAVSWSSDKHADPSCSIAGDQDMYGLGVRLGIYMQLLTTTVVDVFAQPEDAANLTPTNLWFLVAVFVAVQLRRLLSTSSNVAEAYIVISLGNGITLTILAGTLRLHPEGLKENSFTAMCRFLAWGMWKTCSVRFWWVVLDRLESSPCPAFGWLIAPVRLDGWFRIFHKALNTTEWAIWLILFLPYVAGIFFIASCVCQLRDPPKARGRIVLDLPFVPVEDMHRIIFGNSRVSSLRFYVYCLGQLQLMADCRARIEISRK